jgi:hypothetical protein
MLPALEHFWRVAGWWKDYACAPNSRNTALVPLTFDTLLAHA